MRFLRKLDIRKIIMFMIGLLISGGIVYATHTGFAADSEETSYDNSNTDLAATDVQDALDELYSYCIDALVGQEWDFSYKGSPEAWTVPYTGTYRLEVWGAQGGNSGGKGGYSTGTVSLTKGNIIYIVVGGTGTRWSNSSYTYREGGYNGGGPLYTGDDANGGVYTIGTGGGATHIGTFNDALANHGNTTGLYIVAGGGGGGKSNSCSSAVLGIGGGSSGGDARCTIQNNINVSSPGGTQSAGGNCGDCGTANGLNNDGKFGQGGLGCLNNTYQLSTAAGGGGGLYGGGSCDYGAGGGGSGYIGGVTNGTTIAGNTSFPSPSGGTETGHSDNGAAKITFMG